MRKPGVTEEAQPDWADDHVWDRCPQRQDVPDDAIHWITDQLRKEHARALKVVKAKEKVAKLHVHRRNYNQREGYLEACTDILAALQRGRT